MTERPLDISYWRSGLEILSVDIVRPLYPQLGIRVASEEELREAVREALCGRRRRAAPSENRRTLLTGFDMANVAVFLGELDKGVGTGTARELDHWVRYVVCMDSENPWVPYEDLFEVWASRFRKSGRDSFGLSADVAAIEARFRSVSDLDGQTEILEQQRRQRLSDWDASLLAAHGLPELPQGSDFFPLVDAVLLAIGMARFQEFWRWLVSSISPADLSSIQSAAKKRAESKGAPYSPADALPL